MKANRRALARDDEAVSAVVSAVLIFALFTTVMVMYSVQTLPQWEADNEHNHQLGVVQGLGGLRTSLEGLASRHDPGPVSVAVTLGTPTVPLLQTTPARGTLAATTSGTAAGLIVSASFPSAALFLNDGAAAASPSQGVSTPPCSGNCIVALEALLVAFTTTNTATATVTATASDGVNPNVVAVLSLSASAATCGTGNEVAITVGPATSTLLCTTGTALSGYRVDLLNPLYGFASAAARLKAPFALAFTTGAQAAGSTYTAVWQDTSGMESTKGTGVSTTFNPTHTGDRLVFSPSYFHYPNQEVSFEGGAVVTAAGGTVAGVTVAPSFTMKSVGGTNYLRWTLVEMTGSGSVGGTQDATASLTYVGQTDVLLAASGASLTLTTPNAMAWRQFFSDQILVSGAGAVAGGSGTTASLTLTSAWLIHLQIIQASFKVA